MYVGHVARAFEEAGIPTVVVIVSAFRPRAEEMKLPRVLVTPHVMGRTLGAPGDVARQRAVLLAALEMLATAEGNGTMVEFQGAYRAAP